MTITAGELIARLRAEVPEAVESADEHIADSGDPLLHLVLSDLAVMCVEKWQDGDADFIGRALGLVEAGLEDGDEYVENAVSVSFVERVGPWDPDVAEFVKSWPRGLLVDARRHGYPR